MNLHSGYISFGHGKPCNVQPNLPELGPLERAEQIYDEFQKEQSTFTLRNSRREMHDILRDVKANETNPSIVEQVETMAAGIELVAVGKNLTEKDYLSGSISSGMIGNFHIASGGVFSGAVHSGLILHKQQRKMLLSGHWFKP